MHTRKDSSKPSSTVSLETQLWQLVDDYRFTKRKDNRSQAIADLLMKGLKYVELVEKRKAQRVPS